MKGKQKDSKRTVSPLTFKGQKLHVTILTAFVGLLASTVLIIILHTYYKNSKTMILLSEDFINNTSGMIVNKTSNYLRPAAMISELSSKIAGKEIISLKNPESLREYFFEVINLYTQITIFTYGDEKGNFLMQKRMPDGTIATKTINRNISPPTVTWEYRNKAGEIIKTDVSKDVKYDPRVRPWYKGAAATKGLYWTDIYIFFSDREPGITSAYPIIGKNGKITGVIGVDIALQELSNFLNRLKIGKSGAAFIFNSNNELIAFPDISKTVRNENGKLRPARTDETGIAWVNDFISKYAKTKKNKFTFESNGTKYIGTFEDLKSAIKKGWKIGIAVPEDDFIGSIKRTNYMNMTISFIILLVAIWISIKISRCISKPIIKLSEEVKKIKDMHLDDKIITKSTIMEIQMMIDSLKSMKTGLKAFRKYVPAVLVRQLIQSGNEAVIGGHQRELTIFFSDIENFTPSVEKIPPEELLPHISNYFDAVSKIILENKGTVDKFIGDSVMAFWNAPLDDPMHAQNACHSALLCQEKLDQLNKEWSQEGKLVLPTRIGIHTGMTAVGNIGAHKRMNYSILGDNVNTASRLEGVNKVYGTRIIISQQTLDKVDGSFLTRPLDNIAVKGKKNSIMTYELISEIRSATQEQIDFCNSFSKAYELTIARDWKGALDIYKTLIKLHPEDAPTGVHMKRCEDFIKNPPADDWRGIVWLDSK